MSFQVAGLVPLDVLVGDQVQIAYNETRAGSLVVTAVGYPGASSAGGTVTSIASTAARSRLPRPPAHSPFSTSDPELAQNLEVGDNVQVTYTSASGVLTVHSVTVTATPHDGYGGWGGNQP
jgi:hypothetical protein